MMALQNKNAFFSQSSIIQLTLSNTQTSKYQNMSIAGIAEYAYLCMLDYMRGKQEKNVNKITT
jgi:hypothetical protein